MSDVILHHYTLSPYAEKARLALGLKRIDWLGVKTPFMLPKPDLMPLTGGYRRAPVLQIGADVYCDTSLILRELERRKPSPSLWPRDTEGLATAMTWWIEKTTFMPAVNFASSMALAKRCRRPLSRIVVNSLGAASSRRIWPPSGRTILANCARIGPR